MIKRLLGKMYFVATLATFFFIALIVIQNDLAIRALLLLPVVVCYFLAWALYSMNQADMVHDIIEHQRERIRKEKRK